MATTAAIEAERLTKLYGAHRGIEDVTLTVEPGEAFGFLGPNGAGKTTTIRTLARVEELARRFRADLERPMGQLSRGNRQKVGLILAVFHRPELLILDEPTSGLDPLMQEEFLALVREERERGCAVFVSSHELDEVERVCDRVGIIRDGRMIAVERVADLLTKTQRRDRVEVEFGEPVELERVRAMPGVVGAEYAHPTLEEVFLTYYEEDHR